MCKSKSKSKLHILRFKIWQNRGFLKFYIQKLQNLWGAIENMESDFYVLKLKQKNC